MIDSNDILNNGNDRDFGAGDFFCAEGIVARNDDPENRCRVQLKIPIFDEDEIHEVWARRVQIYVGENGFGDYFIPELDTEVLVWGRMGDTNSLFYATLWNEDRKPSADFPNKSVAGLRVPYNLFFIAGQLAKIVAQSFDAIIAQTARILAQNIESNAQELNKLLGNQIQIEASQSALLKGQTVNIEGATITLKNGNVSIQGGNVSITGSSIKLFNRTVNPTGPPI